MRQTAVQSCVADPCPCSGGLRRNDQGFGSSFMSLCTGESVAASVHLLEPFAEGGEVSLPGLQKTGWPSLLTRMKRLQR